MEIQPSAIYLYVVKNPRVTTTTISDHFRVPFQNIMLKLDEMERRGALSRTYAYPGKASVWSAKR